MPDPPPCPVFLVVIASPHTRTRPLNVKTTAQRHPLTMSKLYTLDAIKIADNRQRQEFDPQAMDDLRSSIEDRGLLHAPVVRETADGPVLVAGESRLKAISDIYALGGTIRYNGAVIPEGMVPTVTLGELTELEAEEAELDENLKRKDLTWQERAAAEARLHRLRLKQRDMRVEAAIKVAAATPDAPMPVIPAHTIADTAKELHGRADGSFHDAVRKNVLLSDHLDNPAVAKAKTADEAFKILRKQEEQKRNIDLAVAVGKTFTSDIHSLYNESCLTVMRRPEYQGAFDVILTDPPYGMGADQFGDGGGRLANSEHQYDDSYESWQKLMREWVPLTYAVTKPQAHCYAFCDIDRFHELKGLFEAAGWDVFRTPFVVHKLNSGRVPRPEHGPRRQYELVLYAIKGGKTVNQILPDVIQSQADENMTHGAQKPVAVFQNLLQRSVKPGDVVADWFGGSGPLIPAAHSLKCKAVVTERVPEYFGMCLKRVRDLKNLEEPALF